MTVACDDGSGTSDDATTSADVTSSDADVAITTDAATGDDTGTTDDIGPNDATSDAATTDATGTDATGDDTTMGCAGDIAGDATTAITPVGAITGITDGGTVAFKGIPFAAPPVDELRWRPPQPTGCLDEQPFQADAFGEVCPQPGTGGVIGSEDCLSLNVWTPSVDDGQRPVLVFIHGGAQVQGGASQTVAGAAIYDGQRLAESQNAVVVTIQYRLGALGFLALESLGTIDGYVGNYAILDQIAALGWVRDNIAAFGGNPDDVMIFGESAGAVNVCMLLAAPDAAGLFDAALMQSGFCTIPERSAALAEGASAVALTPCADASDEAACLRGLSATELVSTIPGGLAGSAVTWEPNVDGFVIPDAPLDAMAAGTHNAVPLVIGSNSEEMRSQAIFPITVDTEQEYENTVGLLLTNYGAAARANEVLALYPVADYPAPQDALVQVASDAVFTCPARTIARAAAAGQTESVWRYYFTRRPESAQGPQPAAHGVELVYVFGTVDDIPLFGTGPEDAALATEIMAAWAALASDGDPGSGELTDWPAYDMASDPYVDLGTGPITAEAGLNTAKCDLWDSILAGAP